MGLIFEPFLKPIGRANSKGVFIEKVPSFHSKGASHPGDAGVGGGGGSAVGFFFLKNPRRGVQVGARIRYHLSFWRFFPLFYSNFGPKLRPIHVARPIVVL